MKDLLRESGLPAAKRAEIPLIFAGGALLAVGDLLVNFDHPAVGPAAEGTRSQFGGFAKAATSTTPASE